LPIKDRLAPAVVDRVVVAYLRAAPRGLPVGVVNVGRRGTVGLAKVAAGLAVALGGWV
jgi:hypothetical protein